jgi:hypothetical protein
MQQTRSLDVGLGVQVEHICLESEEPSIAPRPGNIRIGPTFKFVSQLRGCQTELAFSTDRGLSIRRGRPGKPARKYVVDLRFIDTGVLAELRIAWRWWLATAALAALSMLAIWHPWPFVEPRWPGLSLHAAIVVATVAACVGLLSLYQTRVVIELRSVHGDACLAEVTGGLGSMRDARLFVAELSRRVEAARGLPVQPKQQFLRDEMREHHRLSREGVLAADAYEASKRRILAAHG